MSGTTAYLQAKDDSDNEQRRNRGSLFRLRRVLGQRLQSRPVRTAGPVHDHHRPVDRVDREYSGSRSMSVRLHLTVRAFLVTDS